MHCCELKQISRNSRVSTLYVMPEGIRQNLRHVNVPTAAPLVLPLVLTIGSVTATAVSAVPLGTMDVFTKDADVLAHQTACSNPLSVF